jgi:SAM-dependent methyltransferase
VIPSGVRFLDLGCGAGGNLARLAEGGRSGVGLEIDAEAALLGRARGLVVYVGDVRDRALLERIRSEEGAFGLLLFADLLEHLERPDELLLASLPLLGPEGRVVVSLPNVACWYQRLALLLGMWSYSESGILDRTHLRFFTRSSFRRWAADLGFDCVAEDSTPSLVASLARALGPLARRRGGDMERAFGPLFRFYLRFVEPVEHFVCSLWPSLLAFQLVFVLRPTRDPAAARVGGP